jgi:hypothetical protein
MRLRQRAAAKKTGNKSPKRTAALTPATLWEFTLKRAADMLRRELQHSAARAYAVSPCLGVSV